MRFGKWTVLKYIGTKGKSRNGYWECKCDCGNVKEVAASKLRAGESIQCQSCSGKQNGRLSLNAQAKRHLYIVSCGPYFKIGSSDDPDRRIDDLRTANPFPIITECIYLDQGYKEPLLHAYFKQYHHWGEWYLIPRFNLLLEAVELV